MFACGPNAARQAIYGDSYYYVSLCCIFIEDILLNICIRSHVEEYISPTPFIDLMHSFTIDSNNNNNNNKPCRD